MTYISKAKIAIKDLILREYGDIKLDTSKLLCCEAASIFQGILEDGDLEIGNPDIFSNSIIHPSPFPIENILILILKNPEIRLIEMNEIKDFIKYEDEFLSFKCSYNGSEFFNYYFLELINIIWKYHKSYIQTLIEEVYEELEEEKEPVDNSEKELDIQQRIRDMKGE